ncbi:hypothetical protein BATDEDRAFT_35199 [Batrachochytrium dendrobatidis JAM81]|uniref:UDP-galactose transporter n=2 Tax=Batrachochytrium dendrobatidis TaxID=109871 RepID=F4P4M3_BATDJ|nr:uncharacterized protein BATDEDRAFT_35199 [Batrachochytrium dendrobatidis JAM81]EGF79868.1 hypothetical protein BATDEDRAFT_35199 [Batrachochytrium dendrobatidis JAM81]OAJ38713.1 hypothetical protein BDEG_22620 [Batrachochytrium dendrobatidis JEL423]|eukprot:XP_006679534.1 hypothetical protein BATDEDRAFT_35199 [Batrachochytrium dendrobatidis JAM81]
MYLGISQSSSAAALIALVLQSTFLVLSLKYVQNITAASNATPYLKAAVILLAEILKLLCSFFLYASEHSSIASTSLSLSHSFKDRRYYYPNLTLGSLYVALFGHSSQWLKLAIPAILYFIQNCLLYAAADRLDSPTFQVLAQSKLITTAVFSVMMLRKRISFPRIVALGMLTLGIALVQLSGEKSGGNSNNATNEKMSDSIYHVWVLAKRSWNASGAHLAVDSANDKQQVVAIFSDRFIGIIYIFLASTLSGLAGVWFEKVLKEHKTSVWLRNMQLSLFTLPFGLITMAIVDGKEILQAGVFQGFTFWTIIIVFLQALGGLLIAIVVKHADNIVKGFATCISIVFSSILSMYLFGSRVSTTFLIGVPLVIASIVLYARSDLGNIRFNTKNPKRI